MKEFLVKVMDSLNPKISYGPLIILSNGEVLSRAKVLLKAYDDRAYGGNSTCTIEKQTNNNQSFFRFSGHLKVNKKNIEDDNNIDNSHRSEAKSPKVIKRSYCAFNIKFSFPFDLRDYQCLEVTIRNDNKKRDLIFNMHDQYNNGIISQIPIKFNSIPLHQYNNSNQKTSFILPFHLFTTTIQGFEKANGRLNDSLQMQGIGMVLSGEEDDEFQIDLLKVAALTHTPDQRNFDPSIQNPV
eukprot:gene13408-17980_t